jgi:hypothetical protein
MEINLKELSKQEVLSTTGQKKMRLSDNATSMVFQLFTKNVYSNPIGTVVREITSNCFDSHIEAGINAPVVIRKSVDSATGEIHISFIDYGVGMSPDRIENIYGVYFESTKRVDNTQIGGFGIGGKTPLAYKRATGLGEGEYDNSFYVITTYNGIKYFYCMYEGQESPIISLLHSEPTEEHNGTEVRIPVLFRDLTNFKKEMIRQLYYFENIIFEGFDGDTNYDDTLSNEYQIVRAKTFLYRGKDYSDYVHVCLGRVAYPLDFNVLGLSSNDYQFPIAIRLEVGEIGVTVSRETLDYSEATIKLLKKKLIDIKSELIEMISKQYANVVSLEDYFKIKYNFGHIYFPNNSSINVGKMINVTDIDFNNFKYSFMKMPNDKELFRLFFDVTMFGKKLPKRDRFKNNEDDNISYKNIIEKKRVLVYYNNEFQRKIIKQAYLKHAHERYFMISKIEIDRNMRNDITNLFNVHDKIVDDNNVLTPFALTPFAQSLVDLQDEYFEIIKKYGIDYDGIFVPESFIESRKREKLSDQIRKSTIPIRFANSRYRIKFDHLLKLNYRIFYGTEKDKHSLSTAQNIFKLLFNPCYVVDSYSNYHQFNHNIKRGILFIQIAESNVQYMKFCKHANHVDDFEKIMIKRKTAVVIGFFQKQIINSLFSKLEKLYTVKSFSNISPVFADKIKKVMAYIESTNHIGNKDWEYSKDTLSRYYPINDLKSTNKQLLHINTINEGLMMQELNEELVQHIRIPYDLAYNPNDSFWQLMEKILVY